MTSRRLIQLIQAGLTLIFIASPQLQAQPDDAIVAIRASMVWTQTGDPIPNGVILIQEHRILAVGADLAIPDGATLLDYPEGHVMPGMIDAHSHLALSPNPWVEADETVLANTANMHALDVFDPLDKSIPPAVCSGVTTALIAPGNRNPIAGQTAVVKLCPGSEKQWLLKRDAGVKLSVTNETLQFDRRPTSRPGLVNFIKEQFDLAAQVDIKAFDSRTRVLNLAVTGRLPVFLAAEQPDEIDTALDIADSYQIKARLVGGRYADEQADRISTLKMPVIFSPLLQTSKDRDLQRPGRLAQAGVKLAFASHAPHTHPGELRLSAIMAARYGLDQEIALKGLTRHAAEILGVAHRVGSIRKGKDADLVVLSGDPLEWTSSVQAVLINGAVVYQREKP